MQEALRDVSLFCEFARLRWNSRLPDESALLRFRHPLETHKLPNQRLALVKNLLTGKGLVHTVRGAAGNVCNVVQDNSLLHGKESGAFGDANYRRAATPARRTDWRGLARCHALGQTPGAAQRQRSRCLGR